MRKGFIGASRRFEEISKEAEKEGKLPLLVFRLQGKDNLDSLVVCRIKNLKAVASWCEIVS